MSTIADNKRSGSYLMHSNPVLNKLSKVKEIEVADCATYGGIFAKTGYFLLLTVVSILAYAILCTKPVFSTDLFALTVSRGEETVQIFFSKIELIIAAVAALVTIVMPFICAFSIGATPVCGSLYCLGEGYLMAMLIFKLLKWQGIDTSVGLVALLLTVAVVAVMAFLYTRRIVKVDNRFMTVLLSMCGAMILGGLLTFVLSLIPFTRALVVSIANDPVVAIIGSLLSVVLASLFLLSDFAVIENTVENHLPARYEWMASFGLAFTVLWLYLKILQLLVQILGKKNSND